MKILTVMLWIMLTTFPIKAYAQNDNLSFHDSIYLFLRDSCENLVGTACGWAGVTTANIVYTKILLKDNRIDLLTKLIDSNIPATKFLAIQSLLLIDKKDIDSLTNIRITTLKKSKQSVPICLGCVLGYSYSIDTLLNDKINRTGKSIRKYLMAKNE